jgi:hypothetical protein
MANHHQNMQTTILTIIIQIKMRTIIIQIRISTIIIIIQQNNHTK